MFDSKKKLKLVNYWKFMVSKFVKNGESTVDFAVNFTFSGSGT